MNNTRGARAPLSQAIAQPTAVQAGMHTDTLLSLHSAVQQQTKVLQAIESHLRRQVALLTQLVAANQMTEPNYRRPMAQYRTFDWTGIGAVVVEADNYGPTIVEWGGHQWLRRNASDRKFGTAVWFSRHAGGSGYYTLIKFVEKLEVEAMDGRIAERIGDVPAPAPQPQAGVVIEKDWYADAVTSTDELIFDTAVLRHRSNYFGDAEQVKRAREHICGQWNPAKAKVAADALVCYADAILKYREAGSVSAEDSKTAVAKAKRVYEET